MTFVEIRSAIWKFFRRNWMLCTFIAMSLVCITGYDLPAEKLAALLGLIGLFGAVYCLKKFGLDRCIWIYLLPIVLIYLNLTAIAAYRTSWIMAGFDEFSRDWEDLMFFPLGGMLLSLPFSLFFIKKLGVVSALWKVPLCVYCMLLAARPFFWLILFVIIMTFTESC